MGQRVYVPSKLKPLGVGVRGERPIKPGDSWFSAKAI